MNPFPSRTSPGFVRFICLIAGAALFVPCLPLTYGPAYASFRAETNSASKSLPNLDLARSGAPVAPQAVEPIPSHVPDVTNPPDTPDSATQAQAAAPSAPTGVAFDDVPLTHPYNPYIEIIKQRSVTVGCSASPPLYCTNDNVTREQMAAFIIRSLGEFNPPTPPTQRFLDVPPSNIFYNFIDRMAALGITLGCGGGNYCPSGYVTREQMVTFLERAVGRPSPPEPTQQRFTDVPISTSYPFDPFIESFVQHNESRGIMNIINRGAALGSLCGTGNGQTFCPTQLVTRAEMAPLLVMAFGWMDEYTAAARLDQRTRTGAPGEDLFSRNFNWSLPILGLKGRSGLDLGLGLSLNSLPWTKVSTNMIFDVDHGFPGPGFRLGFPVIQKKYPNPQIGPNAYAYLLMTPSGSRVELRETATQNIYESADSSYLKLQDNGTNMYLWTPDGTRMTYVLKNHEYQCTEIKDRNGNFITVAYDSRGHLTTITDTLSRVVSFNYDGLQRLTSITQPSHTWASFEYGTRNIATNF